MSPRGESSASTNIETGYRTVPAEPVRQGQRRDGEVGLGGEHATGGRKTWIVALLKTRDEVEHRRDHVVPILLGDCPLMLGCVGQLPHPPGVVLVGTDAEKCVRAEVGVIRRVPGLDFDDRLSVPPYACSDGVLGGGFRRVSAKRTPRRFTPVV